jgi:hypothetical protein
MSGKAALTLSTAGRNREGRAERRLSLLVSVRPRCCTRAGVATIDSCYDIERNLEIEVSKDVTSEGWVG